MSYHHGNLREAMIDTALEQLRSVGPSGVSLRKISASVGVSRSAAYNHFSNKEELLAAVAERGFNVLTERVDNIGDDARAALRALCYAYLDFAMAETELYKLMFGASIRDMQVHGNIRQAAEESLRVVARAIQACFADAPDDDDAYMQATRLWMMLHGLSAMAGAKMLRGPDGGPLDAVSDEALVDFYIDGVLRSVWGDT